MENIRFKFNIWKDKYRTYILKVTHINSTDITSSNFDGICNKKSEINYKLLYYLP